MTTVSCFFLSFVIVFVVIEPILSNANWKSVKDHQPMLGKIFKNIIYSISYTGHILSYGILFVIFPTICPFLLFIKILAAASHLHRLVNNVSFPTLNFLVQ
jgi:TM2 domain-containing membrane protein YozV